MASQAQPRAELQLEGDSSSNDSQPCYFLDLAPELRNRIYEYILIESNVTDDEAEPIIVDQNTKQPALTLTCHQIRDETLKMWYLRNKFGVIIQSCDVKSDVAFRKWKNSYDFGKDCQLLCKFVGGCDWNALIHWCWNIFHGDTHCPGAAENDDDYGNVIFAALAITDACKGSSWDRCKESLAFYRKVAGAVDGDWLLD